MKQDTTKLNGYIDRLLNGTKKEKEEARNAICNYFEPTIIGCTRSKMKNGPFKVHIEDVCQDVRVALIEAIDNFDPQKVENGQNENYFNSTISRAIARFIEKLQKEPGGMKYPDDVTKVSRVVITSFVNGENITLESVTKLILTKGIRKKEASARNLADGYLSWRETKKKIEPIDNDKLKKRKENAEGAVFPKHSYLEIKEQLNSIFCNREVLRLDQMDEIELERTAQQYSIDYRELLFMRDYLSKESGKREVSNLDAFLLSVAPSRELIKLLITERNFRIQFEQEYRFRFHIDDFCLDVIGVPNELSSPEEVDACFNKLNNIRDAAYVPVLRKNYMRARKNLPGNIFRSEFSKAKTPIEFVASDYDECDFPFTDYKDSEEAFLISYIQSSLELNRNDINANAYLAMLLLFHLLNGHENNTLDIFDSDGIRIPITAESLLKYAEHAFYADYSTGYVDGFLGAMIYALSSEMFYEGPVKSRLFLVKQIFEQLDANGIAHDAYSYVEPDLYDLYFAVLRCCGSQRFTFSDYIETRSMRYDLLQVWEGSKNDKLGKLVISERKKQEEAEYEEAYQMYKDSLILLLKNSEIEKGSSSGSILSFNLLILDLAYPFRPLSNVVNACFREPDFEPMLTHYKKSADENGVVLDNQNIAFLYSMKSGTKYLMRLAVSLVAHHYIKDRMIENYNEIISK